MNKSIKHITLLGALLASSSFLHAGAKPPVWVAARSCGVYKVVDVASDGISSRIELGIHEMFIGESSAEQVSFQVEIQNDGLIGPGMDPWSYDVPSKGDKILFVDQKSDKLDPKAGAASRTKVDDDQINDIKFGIDLHRVQDLEVNEMAKRVNAYVLGRGKVTTYFWMYYQSVALDHPELVQQTRSAIVALAPSFKGVKSFGDYLLTATFMGRVNDAGRSVGVCQLVKYVDSAKGDENAAKLTAKDVKWLTEYSGEFIFTKAEREELKRCEKALINDQKVLPADAKGILTEIVAGLN